MCLVALDCHTLVSCSLRMSICCLQVYAEGAAEEAAKKLRDLNLQEKVGAGSGPPAPTPEELELYGISPSFQEFIRTLNFSLVRFV